MSKITVSLSETMQSYVDDRVQSGEFVDADEYVRELIRADEAHLEWLRAEIQKGFDSGVSPLSLDEIFEEALAEVRRVCA